MYGSQGAPGWAADGGYGTGGSRSMTSASKMIPRLITQTRTRRRLNIVAMWLSFVVPLLVFAVFSAFTAILSSVKPSLTNGVLVLFGAVFSIWAAISIYIAFTRWMAGEVSEEPSWYVFISVTSLLAFLLAASFGHWNWAMYTRPHFDVSNLMNYTSLDPAVVSGEEVMDAGQVVFTPGSFLDMRFAMSFKNQHTFCVVPITGAPVNGQPPLLQSYDYWAVGKDCCAGDGSPNDFQCGEYANPAAHAGVRMTQDGDRAWYRLAVEQAESAFSIKATHPIFFTWTEDPFSVTFNMLRSSYQMYTASLFLFALWQGLLVTTAACVFRSTLGGVKSEDP